MLSLSAAIRGVMVADSTLTALIGVTEGEPSVITRRPVPDNAGWPIVVAETIVADVPADMMVSEGRRVSRDIAVYGHKGQDLSVDQAAERIRALFHRRPLSVSGWQVVDVRASGPISAPVEPQETGRIVTLSIWLHQPK